MRILITGIAGFIGSHLAETFLAEGHQVYGVDNLETGRLDNSPVEVMELDIANRYAFYDYANHTEPDLIVHCAASYKNPDHWHTDTNTNVTGTINAVLAAKHHGARLVYFQTGLPPISSYAISKIAGEQYIRVSGVPHLIFRLANVYGPRNVSGPIPTFYKRITEDLPCTVTDTSRDLVYITDLVACVREALDENLTGTYDVCSGKMTSILDQWRAVNRALGLASSSYLEHYEDRTIAEPEVVPTHTDDVIPDVRPDRGVPRWHPFITLEDGVADAVAWYQTHGVENTYTHLKVKT